MYSFIRDLLFYLEPELSHDFSLDMLGAAERLKLLKLYQPSLEQKPVDVMGIRFPNPVGLAAGLDKNGDYFNAFGALGFGFVEIGTVTPKPQPGNCAPRMFRLEAQSAIINRMGFNNKGVDHLVKNVAKPRRYKGVLGINIGKNKQTPEDQALNDYLVCFDKVYAHADYITVNISSPNTPGLRNLQFGDSLKRLLTGLKEAQQRNARYFERYVPIAVKIAPDMDDDDIHKIAQTFIESEVDGVIATNTTVSREGVERSEFADEQGGLSGRPVMESSTHVLKCMCESLNPKIPVIGVGGIFNVEDVQEKIDAGASLVQLYTGFIYQGPQLIQKAISAF